MYPGWNARDNYRFGLKKKKRKRDKSDDPGKYILSANKSPGNIGLKKGGSVLSDKLCCSLCVCGNFTNIDNLTYLENHEKMTQKRQGSFIV